MEVSHTAGDAPQTVHGAVTEDPAMHLSVQSALYTNCRPRTCVIGTWRYSTTPGQNARCRWTVCFCLKSRFPCRMAACTGMKGLLMLCCSRFPRRGLLRTRLDALLPVGSFGSWQKGKESQGRARFLRPFREAQIWCPLRCPITYEQGRLGSFEGCRDSC